MNGLTQRFCCCFSVHVQQKVLFLDGFATITLTSVLIYWFLAHVKAWDAAFPLRLLLVFAWGQYARYIPRDMRHTVHADQQSQRGTGWLWMAMESGLCFIPVRVSLPTAIHGKQVRVTRRKTGMSRMNGGGHVASWCQCGCCSEDV
jgi:hypothetical protein